MKPFRPFQHQSQIDLELWYSYISRRTRRRHVSIAPRHHNRYERDFVSRYQWRGGKSLNVRFYSTVSISFVYS